MIRRVKPARAFCLFLAFIGMAASGVAHAQEDQAAPDPEKEKQEFAAINAELENVAREIAGLLKHPGFRGQLRGEINGAQTRENIIVLDKFLAKVAKQQKSPPGLDKARSQTEKAVKRIAASPAWAFEGIDLYFPVKDHKAKWKGSEDLLVAFSPADNEDAVTAIVGFSVKSQQKVMLDPDNPPATPVLMVAPEEHEDHNLPTVPRDDASMVSPTEEAEDKYEVHFRGEEPEEAPVPQEEGNSYVGLYQMYIRDVKEPWTRGDPEIAVYFGQRKGNYCEEHQESHRFYPLYGIDDARRWYTTWPQLPSSAYCTYGSYSTPCWYFDPDFYSRMVLYIYEKDGGSSYSKTYELYPGVICSWYHSSGDDYIDSGLMYRNNFPFNYTYGQDLGNAIVRWHKVH